MAYFKRPTRPLGKHVQMNMLFGAVFFSFIGVAKILLWVDGEGNDLGLFLSIGMVLVGLLHAAVFLRQGKDK